MSRPAQPMFEVIRPGGQLEYTYTPPLPNPAAAERAGGLPDPGYVVFRSEDEDRGVIDKYGCFAWLSDKKFDEATQRTMFETFGNVGSGLPLSLTGEGIHALLLLACGQETPELFHRYLFRRYEAEYRLSEDEVGAIFGRNAEKYRIGQEPLPPKSAPTEAAQPAGHAAAEPPVTHDQTPPGKTIGSSLAFGELSESFAMRAGTFARLMEHYEKGKQGQPPMKPAFSAQPAIEAPKPTSEPRPPLVLAKQAEETSEPSAERSEPQPEYFNLDDDDDALQTKQPDITPSAATAGLSKHELAAKLVGWRDELGKSPAANFFKRHKLVSGLAAFAFAGVAVTALHNQSTGATTEVSGASKDASAASSSWAPPAQPLDLGTFKVEDKLGVSVPYTENGKTGWFPQIAPDTAAAYYTSDASTWRVSANEAVPGLVGVEGSTATVDLGKIALNYQPVPMSAEAAIKLRNDTLCTAGSLPIWHPMVDAIGFIDCGIKPIDVAKLTASIKAGVASPISVDQANEINANLADLSANNAADFEALNQLAAGLNLDRTEHAQFTAAIKQQLAQSVQAATKVDHVKFIHTIPSGTASYLNTIGKEQGATTNDSLQIDGIKAALTDYNNATVTKQ